ncbi:hypothetical protein D6779_10815 [Candidatus Parcubacteria bacterium]|nr:MAG: hypothetical protein D6779_10815 [Candidatus Parcubacteria bacterium]
MANMLLLSAFELLCISVCATAIHKIIEENNGRPRAQKISKRVAQVAGILAWLAFLAGLIVARWEWRQY